MPKEFYTERDIEDLFRRGVLSLAVGDDVVLTALAYEKAGRLGMKLVRDVPAAPPAAPVRPYLSQAANPAALPGGAPAGGGDLTARIRDAVNAKLGSQVDPALLEVIIKRVLQSTGVR